MKSILLIRIPPPVSRVDTDTTVQWGVYSSNGQLSGNVHISHLGQLREEWLRLHGHEGDDPSYLDDLMPDNVTVLLSGSLAVHRLLEINAGQRKHLNTALPYMIEEELAQDIDALHLASQLQRKSDWVSLSAVPHEQMQKLLACLDGQGLGPRQILSELQFIPSQARAATIILEHHSVLLSIPDEGVVHLDYDALRLVLEQQNRTEPEGIVQNSVPGSIEPQQGLTSVNLIFADGNIPAPAEVREKVRSWVDEQGWLVDETALPGSVFEYLAERFFEDRRSGQLVDLRHGPYQCPKQASRRIRRWKPLALVASIWLLMELGLRVGEGMVYQNQAQDYWDQSAELYLQAFPKDQQVLEARASGQGTINVRSRMESRLKGQSRNATGEPFLPLLQRVSAVSSSLEGVQIEPLSMDFNETSGRLVLDLKAETLEGVDKLLAAIKSSGLSARLDNANQEKTGVNARMTIGR